MAQYFTDWSLGTHGHKNGIPNDEGHDEKDPRLFASRVLRVPHDLLPAVQRHNLKRLQSKPRTHTQDQRAGFGVLACYVRAPSWRRKAAPFVRRQRQEMCVLSLRRYVSGFAKAQLANPQRQAGLAGVGGDF